MLLKRKGFEIRLGCHVLGLDYDRPAKRVAGVRYVDLVTGEEYEQSAEVVVLAAFTMTNTRFAALSRIGAPYDPVNDRGVVGKNFCYQTMSASDVFFKDQWINPFLAAGSTGYHVDEYNNDNFDHTGLGFLGGANIGAGVSMAGRSESTGAARHPTLGHASGSRRTLSGTRTPLSSAPRGVAIRTATITWTSIRLYGRLWPATLTHDVRLSARTSSRCPNG